MKPKNTPTGGLEPPTICLLQHSLWKVFDRQTLLPTELSWNGRALFLYLLGPLLEVLPLHLVANQQPHYIMPTTQGWITLGVTCPMRNRW